MRVKVPSLGPLGVFWVALFVGTFCLAGQAAFSEMAVPNKEATEGKELAGTKKTIEKELEASILTLESCQGELAAFLEPSTWTQSSVAELLREAHRNCSGPVFEKIQLAIQRIKKSWGSSG